MKQRYYKHKQSGQIGWLSDKSNKDIAVLVFPNGETTALEPGRFRRDYEAVKFAPDDPLPDEPARCYSYFLDFLLYSPSEPGQVQKKRTVNGFYKSLPNPKPSDNAIRKWSEQFNWMERAMEYDFGILEQKRKHVREQRSKQLLGKEA